MHGGKHGIAALGSAIAICVASAPASAHLSPAPSVCTGEPNANCIEKGGGGNTTVSPTLVHVGQVVTFKLTSLPAQYGGVRAGWSFSNRATGVGSAAGLRLLGCHGSVHHGLLAGSAICRYRVLSAGRGWQAAVASFDVEYGGLASYSEAAWRAVPKGYYVEGYIHGRPDHRGASGTPLDAVPVSAHGPSYDATQTNAQGYYVLQLAKPGRYKVVARLRSIDLRLHPQPTFSPGSHIVQVTSTRVSSINFRLSRGDDITISFAGPTGAPVTGIPADGVSSTTALVDAFDANNQPLTGQPLDIVIDAAQLSSKAIVCDPNQDRLWPGNLVGTTRSGQVFSGGNVTTTPDAQGRLRLTIYSGTEAGALAVTARRQGASPVYDVTAMLALTPPQALPSLQAATLYAKSGYQTNYPNPAPLNTSAESTWQLNDIYYLADAKTHGYFGGWEYVPVATTSGSPQRYGIYFYKNGNAGGGGVLETTNQGFAPLETGNPLPSVGSWSNGSGYTFDHLVTGYPGDDLFYLGWPYERTSADACIRRAPN